MQPFSKIDTIIIRVKNLEESHRWYEEKLGLKAGYEDQRERLVVFHIGGETSLTVWELKPGESIRRSCIAPCFPIFYARDIETSRNILTKKGVKPSEIEGDVGGTRWFTFLDPDGNRFEVCTY